MTNELWKNINTAIGNLYSGISLIINSLCVIVAAVCLVLMLVSRNTKAVEESRTWLKRIIACFCIFNALGTIVKYANELMSSSNFSTYTAS